MTTLINTRVLLVNRPRGKPKASDFCIDQTLISSSAPAGGILIQTTHISIDPAMRGWMSDAKSYLPPVKLGDVMRATCVGVVIASGCRAGIHSSNNISVNTCNKAENVRVGQMVKCDVGGVQTYVSISEDGMRHVKPLPQMAHGISPSAYLGVLGTTGLTAYFGFYRVGLPKEGDAVLVSGAAGATGSVVAQIAKRIMKCRVIGTAGSDEKCKWLTDNDIVDVAINYKVAGKSLSRVIREAAYPKGVNIVFDNVGGPFLEAALSNLALGARVVLCGAISQYNSDSSISPQTITGPRNYMNLLVKRASMKGFVVFDYRKEYRHAIGELSKYIANGRLIHSEYVVEGIENFHTALMTLFDGTNRGKAVLKVSPKNFIKANL